MNPFDEIALEESLRLREKLGSMIKEIVAVSCGPDKCQETLRTALALGADRAIFVRKDDSHKEELLPIDVARIFHQIVQNDKEYGLVMLGKQAIDDDSNHVGQLLSGMLGWPQATFISKLQLDEDAQNAIATCEVDFGMEDIRLKLPAVITTDLRLNEPRYATLQNIMKAKAKPIQTLDIGQFKIGDAKHKVGEMSEPAPRSGGKILSDIPELFGKIQDVIKT